MKRQNRFELVVAGTMLFVAAFWAVLVSQQQTKATVQAQSEHTEAAVVRAAGTDLCTAEPDHTLNDGENTYDGTDIDIIDCAFVINGTHSFTAITIGNGAGSNDSILRHSETNTTTVFKIELTVTNNMTVNSDGLIDAAGRGFLGATNGTGNLAYTYVPGIGNENQTTTTGASSGAQGGSYGGEGGYGNQGGILAAAYGLINDPKYPGSGGGPYNGCGGCFGGDGGGLVRLTVGGTMTLNGTVSANGLPGAQGGAVGGGGAGGGVYINAGTVSGTGSITAIGGNGNIGGGYVDGGGGGGRIAVLYTNGNPLLWTMNVYGGSEDNGEDGGAGTIFLKSTGQTNGDLYIANSTIDGSHEGSTPFSATPTVFDSITLSAYARASSATLTQVVGTMSLNNAWFTQNNGNTTQIQIDTLTLANNAVLYHRETNTTTAYKVNISAVNVSIDASSSINGNGRGFLGATNATSNLAYTYVPGGGNETQTTTSGASSGAQGGSYGGEGGFGNQGGVLASTYGDLTDPQYGGSGGGPYNGCGGCFGGDGGGLIRLVVSGTLTLNGTLTVNGAAGAQGGAVGGGGAGGGVYINANTLAGTGTINANGGNGNIGFGYVDGGGGGGRIAIVYTNGNPTLWTKNAIGGSEDNGQDGGAGTVFVKSAAQTNGDLFIANSTIDGSHEASTPLPATPTVFDNLTISAYARASSATLTQVVATMSLNNAWFTQDNGHTTTLQVATLTLANSALFTHKQTNTTTAYKVNVSATTLTIDSGTSFNVDGRGFLGATNATSNLAYTFVAGNGNEAQTTTTGASSGAQGGSYGGEGGFGNQGGILANSYGDLTDPKYGGSGGGPYNGCGGCFGGDGGGLIRLVVSGTLTLNGTLTANGAAGAQGGAVGGGGAGGGVYINATTIAGNGTINANGGNGNIGFGYVDGGGGGGRIAILYTTGNPTLWTKNAYGGSEDNGEDGGAGTVFVKSSAQTNGDLIISNNGVDGAHESSTIIVSPIVFDAVSISGKAKAHSAALNQVVGAMSVDDARYTMANAYANPLTVGSVALTNSGLLNHAETTTATAYHLIINAGSFSIDATSSINVAGRGFLGASNSTGNTAYTFVSGNGNENLTGTPGNSTGANGGSHGGYGGLGNQGGVAGVAFDDFANPKYGGGGGGPYNGCGGCFGGDGGGSVRLTVTGTLTLNGTINANGSAGAQGGAVGGGGAGGGVYINATTIAGSGTVSANGGNGNFGGGYVDGGGGGGRIAILYTTGNPAAWTKTVIGGSEDNGQYGGSGTVFVKASSQTYGDFTTANNGTAGGFTPLFVTGGASTYTLQNLSVLNFAKLLIDTPCLGTPALTVNGFTDLSGSGTITNNQGGSCTVSQAPISVTTTSLPTATANAAYSQTIQSAGGYGPHTFVCRNGGVNVACTTVLPAGLNMSSSGVVSGTPTVAGTTLFTVRATEASPGVGFDEETISITVGNAPSAPTSLFSHTSNAQSCCVSPVTDATPVFSAIFNDADTGNTAAKYRLQVASDAGFTTLLWDSGASGTAIASCTIGARCANISYAGSALSLGGVTYHWRIKFWDSADLEGAFSAGSTFTTSSTPTAPTALFSNDANAQSGLTNPIGILAAHPVFSAVYNDPDATDTADKYRIQVDNNSNFSSPIWDSGAAGTSMATCNQGARCADITFGGTDIAQNGALYYWRIKFFDASGLESPWSQDPVSTNTFSMGQGGTSIQVQQQQAQQPQATVPDAPQAGAVESVGSGTVRYNWVDMSNNEVGFRILNEQGNIIADVGPGITQAEETGLPDNTAVSGRSVIAYNSVGVSAASLFAPVVTAAPTLRPVLRQRGGDSVTFTIEPTVTSFPGQSALRFDIIVVNSLNQSRTLTSDWIQTGSYTFSGVQPGESVQVRVTMRNQAGLQNEPSDYEDIGSLSRRFAVTIGVFKKGTETLPRPMAATDVIAVRMALESIGADAATSVTLNLPLPKYILYRPGTMIVDGAAGMDAPSHGSVGNQNGVSASWSRVAPGERHTVSFELAFDVEALRALIAAANPLIPLQASVSFAESDAVYMSPVITLEPDIATSVEPEPVEEPIVEPEPTEETPVVLPTPEETQIIERILQQEFPNVTPTPSPTSSSPSSPPSEAPSTLQTGETNTSTDGNSFNVGVTGEDKRLGLSGSASVKEDSIAFTGTTTEPFTVITLIFNDSVTAIVVSDAQGQWQTFVSAERLGIQPGQDAVVKIEAIAAKGDLRSERVSVGEVTVSRGRSGAITAEFESVVSKSPALTVIKEVQKQVVRTIEQNQPAIQTTLVVSAPVVVASSVPLWGYLPYAPTMIYHLITYVVGYSGRKKRLAARFYGVAYDSITKQPLALAIIRIYRIEAALPGAASLGAAAAAEKKLVTTVVTDKQGRYDALLQPAIYQLEVAKPGYAFPSRIVTASFDADYQHVYNQEQGIRVEGDQLTIPDVPLDPVNQVRQWELASGLKKIWMLVQKAGGYIATPILLVGAVSSVAVVAAVPDKIVNWIIAGAYIVLLAMQLKLKPKAQKAWGVVYDMSTNAGLPLAALQLIEPSSGKVVASRLSDYEGRFAFMPEPGAYVLKASKNGFAQVEDIVQGYSDRQPLPKQIEITKPNQRIAGDIAMKQT